MSTPLKLSKLKIAFTISMLIKIPNYKSYHCFMGDLTNAVLS